MSTYTHTHTQRIKSEINEIHFVYDNWKLEKIYFPFSWNANTKMYEQEIYYDYKLDAKTEQKIEREKVIFMYLTNWIN